MLNRRRMMVRNGETQWTPPANPWTFAWSPTDGESDLYPVQNGVKMVCGEKSDGSDAGHSNWMHVSTYDQNKAFIKQTKFVASATILPDEAAYVSVSIYHSTRFITITWL